MHSSFLSSIVSTEVPMYKVGYSTSVVMDAGKWCMELMKERGKEVGTPSNSMDKRRRRKGRMTFSSAKQWWVRVQKRREAGSSKNIDRQSSWRLSCKICSIHLESIPEEEEAASSASRGKLALTVMTKEESKQPSFTAQSDSKDMEKK